MIIHHRHRMPLILAAVICIAVFGGGQELYALELSVKNELRNDEAGSVLYIEDARSVESPKSRFTASIQPGKTVKITRGNLLSMMLVRPFSRHKLKYEVSCKKKLDGTATVTLLDIHNGKLPDGCKVTRVGHWSRRTGLNWRRK